MRYVFYKIDIRVIPLLSTYNGIDEKINDS